jgi:penicillin amidase
MLSALDARRDEPAMAAMRPYVQNWGGRALPDSVGYRLVRRFERDAVRLVYAGLTGAVAGRLGSDIVLPGSAARPAQRVLEARPSWVAAPFHDWGALEAAALDEVQRDVARQPGGLAEYRWGALNRVGIRHPLSGALPGLSWLTDPGDVAVAGDSLVPRVVVPGDGASERLVVSPGHEASGILEMPAGQSDNPLSPYYLAGQRAWVAGLAVPLRPGAARWTLHLDPKIPQT